MANQHHDQDFTPSAESFFEKQQRLMVESLNTLDTSTTSDLSLSPAGSSSVAAPSQQSSHVYSDIPQRKPLPISKTPGDTLSSPTASQANDLRPASSTNGVSSSTDHHESSWMDSLPALPSLSALPSLPSLSSLSASSATPPKTIDYNELRNASGLAQNNNTASLRRDSSSNTNTSSNTQTAGVQTGATTTHPEDAKSGEYGKGDNFGTVKPLEHSRQASQPGQNSIPRKSVAFSDANSTPHNNTRADTIANSGSYNDRPSDTIPVTTTHAGDASRNGDGRPATAQSHASRPDYVLSADPTPYGQAYSDRRAPPTVAGLREHEATRSEASRKYLESLNKDQAQDKHVQGTVASTSAQGSEQPTAGDDARAGATEDVPIGAEKSNVLFHPTPQVNFDRVFETLEVETRRIGYIIFGAIIILDYMFIGGGFKGFLKSLFPASGVAAMVYYILKHVAEQAKSAKITKAKAKTEKLKFVPESVEWMNTLVQTLWHTLQQDFFDNIAHTIDDTIKPYIPASVPATVKITDLGHGTHAARVLSMRSLPDSEFGDLVPVHGIDRSGSAEQQQRREKAVKREEGGVFYNLEIAVAYHAAPLLSRKEHMHVDILATVGPVPLPIFVEVKEFVATIRIRLQMHPDLPFLKNVTFALTEKPKVNTSVSIGAPWAFNILNLPVIDNVLASQIDAAASDYVQPKSMSMDMTIYVGGSDQKEDTDSIGVLFVKIHRARQLARQDSRGPGADPYLTIAFSKYEKPMYATRIIKGDRNPVWEETAIIMIKPEHVKRNENVLLRLWDSDTMGSDDVSGVCEFPLRELILNANNMEKREDRLQGDVAGTDAEGVLEWEIGYFPRADYNKALRTDAKDPKDHHGEKKEISEEEKEVQGAQNTVPDPNLPSGILGLTIHQLINVQVDNPNKKSMGHVTVQKQDSDGEDLDEEDESVAYLPSLYVSADINDQLIYRTRQKPLSTTPTYNSSTEQYVRDWRLATLTLSVWDTRKKTDDCLVGVASIKMSDIFHESSSVVNFYELKGGAGTGRIRVSMIFRSIRMQLEKSLLGYSVGTFEFTSPIVATGEMKHNKLKLRTSGSTRSIKGSGDKDGDAYTWQLQEPNNKLPVQFRYLSPVVFEFVGRGLTEKISGPLGKDKHYAVLWLFRLVDNQPNTFTLPIFKTDNAERLIQNVVSESDDTMHLEKVGEVRFNAVFKAGIGESHEEFLDTHDRWSTFQSWKAARSAGLRGEQVNSTTNANVQRLAQNAGDSGAIPV